MAEPILVCTDLDRTLLPNGLQPESAGARERFSELAGRSEVRIAYVTGRHRQLVLDALDEYDVPLPDYVIGDVGTSIYTIENGNWRSWEDWQTEIGASWQGMRHDELARVVAAPEQLRLQEPEKQGPFKLSYYADTNIDVPNLLATIEERLEKRGIEASLIWSVDETRDLGLLDVLPSAATKVHAVQFLMRHEGFTLDRTVFAGDSGNDIPVLASAIPAVLVANATQPVRDQALEEAARNNTLAALYLARGNFAGMNGNYGAGILEGLAHYRPETRGWWQ